MIGPIVDLPWWRDHRDTAVTCDVRWYLDGRSGRAAYDAGHLPGAVFVDLDRWLAAPGSAAAGRHPLPDPATFATGMSALGIGDDAVVVAYDDAGGVTAARLVWLLRATGHEAALLDGGIAAFDGPLVQDAPPARKAAFTPVPWPEDRLASLEEAAGRGAVLLDVRDAERYRGEVEPVDPRAGHVPGAVSLPTRDHLGPDGRHLPVPVLRERFRVAGAGAGDVIASCGSGVTACHTLLVREHAGLGTGRLYPGSWSQYSHTTLPAAVGPEPG